MNANFDDFDDDTGSYDRVADDQIGASGLLLRRALDIIATAPNLPLSASPRIDRDEIIDILESALSRLPDELRQARWMMKERDEFVARTKREADEIIEAAKVQAERFVQRAEIVRAAEQRARQIIEAAEDESRRQKRETEDFLDQRLASFEILLDKLTKTVDTGRRRLAIGAQTELGDEAEGFAPVEEYADESGSIFFDQDNTSGR